MSVRVPRFVRRRLLALVALVGVASLGQICEPLPPVGRLPYLWLSYTTPGGTFLRQTSRAGPTAVFSEPEYAMPRQLVAAGLNTTRPSLTTHRGSQWLAWREGRKIRARSVGWGPSHTRTVYASGGGASPSPPAVASYGGRLVVVWSQGDTLYLSHSEYGVHWSAPLGKRFAGSKLGNPALAVHGDDLFVGLTAGWSLYTVLILEDLTWGPNFAGPRSQVAIWPEVSLASDGVNLSVGFGTQQDIYVIHSPSGYKDWSAPSTIDTIGNKGIPALAWFDDRLYALYPTASGRLILRRSQDRRGWIWTVPRIVVMAQSAPEVPVALVASDYSSIPPTPAVVAVNDSGLPAINTLNLVFVSEGYREDEMDAYRALVTRVSDAFRVVNPFSKHLDKFNMYRIDLPSREKGVDASPALAAAVQQGVWDGSGYQAPVPAFQPRYTDTALGAAYWGCWGPPHYNSDQEQTQSSPNNARTPLCDAGEEAGNPHTQITLQKAIHIWGYYAYDLVEQLVPGFDRSRDLLYVIVDQIPEDGGTDKASYNPVVSTDDFAEGLGNIHEIAHFTTRLDDEDFSYCCGSGNVSQCVPCPNKSINPDLADPNHEWAHFFVSQGRPGDSIVANPKSRPPSWSDFWDTTAVNANHIFNTGLWATNGVGDWSATGGRIVYGPAQQCLMNHTGGTTHFCPVCTEELTKEIYRRASQPFDHNAYHGTYDRVYVEYQHRRSGEAERPKAGSLSLNGQPVPASSFTCHPVRDRELCSVDVTALLHSGANQIVFLQQQGVSAVLDLQTIQVVNSNGATLPLFPMTDLSGIATVRYLGNYFWSVAQGDLTLEFQASVQGSGAPTP